MQNHQRNDSTQEKLSCTAGVDHVAAEVQTSSHLLDNIGVSLGLTFVSLRTLTNYMTG